MSCGNKIVSKLFQIVSSANISLSIYKNSKNHKNSTPSKIKFHIIWCCEWREMFFLTE